MGSVISRRWGHATWEGVGYKSSRKKDSFVCVCVLGLLRNIQGWDYRGRRDCQELGFCPGVLFSCANFTHAKPHPPFPLLNPPCRMNLMEGMSRYTVFPGWKRLLAGWWLDLSRGEQRWSSSGDGELSVRVFSFPTVHAAFINPGHALLPSQTDTLTQTRSVYTSISTIISIVGVLSSIHYFL